MSGNRILVTGGTGFIGKHLVAHLHTRPEELPWDALAWAGQRVCYFHEGINRHRNKYPNDHDWFRRDDFDLTFKKSTQELFDYFKPTHVFHLAGYNGGMDFNIRHPVEVFAENTLMALNVLAAARPNVKRAVSLVTSCGSADFQHYPEDDNGDCWEKPGILREADYLRGRPHPTVACHGYAKRNLLVATQFYNEQYGTDFHCVCPTTVYGPGDKFDPARSKVMAAMVKRFVDAHKSEQEEVACWGTGAARREFIYVEDVARMLVEFMAAPPFWLNHPPLLNLGTGQELTMREITETVAARVGYAGRVTWDASKPDGQLRKALDTTWTRAAFHKFPFTPLEDGLDKTISWYRANHA